MKTGTLFRDYVSAANPAVFEEEVDIWKIPDRVTCLRVAG